MIEENMNQENIEDLDEKNLQVLGDEASNISLSDSDIDDPKYMPGEIMENKGNITPQQFPIHQDIFIRDIQEKIQTLKNDTDLKLKNIRQIENENMALKNELTKSTESLKTKDQMIEEFQKSCKMIEEKFTQYDKKNSNLELENKNLKEKIQELEGELEKLNIKQQENESNSKNITLYQAQINELQNEISQKETKLKKRYQEKENSLKMEFLADIEKLRKEIDDTKVQNEKLKYDLSNQNINIESLKSKLEDTEYESKGLITKKDKEISRLNDKIAEIEKNISEIENSNREQVQNAGTEIQSLKDEDTTLQNELKIKSEKEAEFEATIYKLNHEIELLKGEVKENNFSLQNKDRIIEQLKHQSEGQNKAITDKEVELEMLKEGKEKEFEEYNNAYNESIRQNNQLEMEIMQLKEGLEQRKRKISELTELINSKFSSIEQDYYKEIAKKDNVQKKFKGIIKQMKQKEKNLFQENKTLKDKLNEKELEKEQMENHYQNELKNMSLLNVNNPVSNSMIINANNTVRTNNLTNIGVNYSFYGNPYGNGLNVSTYRFDDPKEETQKKALEDFKRLLAKLDEKLDMPSKN